MWRTGFIFLALLFSVHAHVQLLYPPATLNLDFLDTFRTTGICGHEASGAEQTEEWKLPMYDSRTVTEIETGSNLTVFWALHYAHQGGWLFELYNEASELTSTWNSSDHWDCVSDSTQQTATLKMPDTPCEGCVLRLRRQALEWGATYRFHSCALVNIVEQPDDVCNGCSGHGRCRRGSCRCDRSVEKGFWYGEYCEKQDECDEDEHCGEGGVCVDSGNITPPGKQCYCRTGWFGSETEPLEGSYITSRICDRQSKMSLGNPRRWAEQYDFEFTSVPEGNFKLYYTIDRENEEIEFAIRAKTRNWAAFGFRPIATGIVSDGAMGSEVAMDYEEELDLDAEDGEGEGEGDGEEGTEGEGEGEGGSSKRRLLRVQPRMPEILAEAETTRRSLLQGGRRRRQQQESEEPESEGADSEGADAEGADSEGGEYEEGTEKSGRRGRKRGGSTESEGAEGEGEGAAEGDGEADAEGEGSGDDDGLCPNGDPTTTEYDEGLHDLIPTRTRRRGQRGLLTVEMPSLLSEKTESHKHTRSLKDEDDDSESEGEGEEHSEGEGEADSEGEGEGEGEADSEGEGGTGEGDDAAEVAEEYVPEFIAVGTECENLATSTAAHPMINQDIYVVYGKRGMFRIQDSFTPSRAKPLPDVFYGGADGIIDAIGSESAGYTNVKFRRKLSSVDAAADYCILEDVDYLMVYAYGQRTNEYTHIPNSGLETGRASNLEFYGQDELKFHGGGIGTSFEGRGVLTTLNFFDEPRAALPEGASCAESNLDNYDCMQEELNGEYKLHWRVDEDGVAFAAETTGTGWAAVGWPETPGVMIGTQAVLGLGGDTSTVSVYRLVSKNAADIVEDEDPFTIEDASIEQGGGSTLLQFKRIFDDSFDGVGELDLVVAFNPTANEIAYHGFATRGGITVALS